MYVSRVWRKIMKAFKNKLKAEWFKWTNPMNYSNWNIYIQMKNKKD